jgi:hypothetical protein
MAGLVASPQHSANIGEEVAVRMGGFEEPKGMGSREMKSAAKRRKFQQKSALISQRPFALPSRVSFLFQLSLSLIWRSFQV